MALWIQNISGDDRDDDQLHDYRLMINHEELCRFQHVRSHGAAECLRVAAEAIEAVEGGKARPLRRAMMARDRWSKIKASER